MNWFFLSIIATSAFGIQSFLYKSAVARGCNKFLVTLTFMATVELLAIFSFLYQGAHISQLLFTAILGFLFASLFWLKTLGQLKALEYLPTNKVFPITSSSVAVTVIYALVLLKESITPLQLFGILSIVLAGVLINRESKKRSDYHENKIGFLISFLVILPAAAMEITNKYAALNTNINFFIVVTYLFSILISSSSYLVTRKANQISKNITRDSIKFGLLIGIINFIGYLSILSALKTGHLSLIAPILALSVIITVLLAKIVHKEELNIRQFGLVLLSVFGIVLLRI